MLPSCTIPLGGRDGKSFVSWRLLPYRLSALDPIRRRPFVGYVGVEPTSVLLPKQAAHPEPCTRGVSLGPVARRRASLADRNYCSTPLVPPQPLKFLRVPAGTC